MKTKKIIMASLLCLPESEFQNKVRLWGEPEQYSLPKQDRFLKAIPKTF